MFYSLGTRLWNIIDLDCLIVVKRLTRKMTN